MASSPNGLNNNRSCWLPSTVVPDAKYQSGAAVRVHDFHPDVAAVFEDVRHRDGAADRLDDHAGLGRGQDVGHRHVRLFTGREPHRREAGAASPPGMTVMVASMSCGPGSRS